MQLNHLRKTRRHRSLRRSDPTRALISSPARSIAAHYKWWAFTAISIGLFTSVADHGGIIVALPTISEYFGTDLPTTQWVFLGYVLTVSALLLPMGRLADVVGIKKVFVVGLAIFVVGALLAGMSDTIFQLIGSRVVMGVGSAMTQGTSMAIGILAFPSAERGKAIGLQMGVVGFGNLVGPAVGGFVVSAFGWRGVPFSIAAVSIVATLVAIVILDGRKADRDSDRVRFDLLGAVVSTVALVTFLLVMTSGPRVGWINAPIIVAVLAIAALISGFVWIELRAANPMLYLGNFKERLFSFGVAAAFMSFTGTSAMRFMMPFFLQAVLGFSPKQIGLMIIPSALAISVAGPLGGMLSDRYGWRWFNVGGLALVVIGLLMLSRITETSSVYFAITGMLLLTTGSGTFYSPNSSSVLSTVKESEYSVIVGFLNLVRNAGNLTGIAVSTAIVTAMMAASNYPPTLSAVSEAGGEGVLIAFTSGLRLAFAILAGVVAVGMVLSMFKGASPVNVEIQ